MELHNTMIANKETVPCEIASETRVINKCPKSFSIESLISRNSPPAESNVVDNAAKEPTSALASSLNFTHNFPVAAAAAAAAIYNPWIHSYLAQQHPPPAAKYPATVEMLPSDLTKDRLSEMFTDPRIIFGASDYRDKFLAQCFVNNVRDKKFSDLFMSTSEYYGNGVNIVGYPMPNNYNSDLSLNGLPADVRIGASCENANSMGDSNETQFEDRSTHNNRCVNIHSDEVDVNDDLADELDSDCSSEISMTMSPDAANRINGMCRMIKLFCFGRFMAIMIDWYFCEVIWF